MPIFLLFFIIIPRQNAIKRMILKKIKTKNGGIYMTNELISKYIGNQCQLYSGSFGSAVIGKIIDINENWIEVETKKGKELVNVEFVQNIRIINK